MEPFADGASSQDTTLDLRTYHTDPGKFEKVDVAKVGHALSHVAVVSPFP